MARPSILTEAFIADFCTKLRVSGSIETAIKTTGIGRESYYGWARQVRDGGGSSMARKFIVAVEKAEGEVKMMRERMLSKHFDKNWACLAWWLERKFPLEYSQRRYAPIVEAVEDADTKEIERVVWRPARKPLTPLKPSPQYGGPSINPEPESEPEIDKK